jgi:hypothetical protein
MQAQIGGLGLCLDFSGEKLHSQRLRRKGEKTFQLSCQKFAIATDKCALAGRALRISIDCICKGIVEPHVSS